MTRTVVVPPSQIEELGKSIGGVPLRPGGEAYEAARLAHNGMIDKRPVLIAQCTGVAEIQQAVDFGRDRGILLEHFHSRNNMARPTYSI